MGKTNRCNMQEDVTVKAEIVKKYKNTFLSCYFKRSPNAVLSEDFVFLSVFLIHLVKRCSLSLSILTFLCYLNLYWHLLLPEAELGLLQQAVSYYHKALHLGCCSSPRSASDCSEAFLLYKMSSV